MAFLVPFLQAFPMTAKPDFVWQSTTKIESQAHVHAIGMITLNASLMEEALTLLLAHFLQMQKQTAISLIHTLAIRNRSDLLRHLVDEKKEKLGDLFNHITFALDCFNIAIENRNIIVHALYVSVDRTTETMTVSKRLRKNPANEFKLRLPLTTLRQTADEIGNTVNYLLDLWFTLTHGPGTNTLIRKPLLPNKLSPPPPPKAPKGARSRG
jgi:hypothetical protein